MEKVWKKVGDNTEYGKGTKINHEQIILKGEPYEDPDFKPGLSSLIHSGKEGSKIASATKKMWKDKITWKRLSEIYPDANIYKEEITSEDVAPGIFDDSYVQAALSRVAQDSGKVIKQCFVTKDINSVGVYVITIFIDGSPNNVLIDDYVPYFETSKQPAFTNTASDSIWALLIEKAWAKVCGSYEKAHSLDCLDLFSFV